MDLHLHIPFSSGSDHELLGYPITWVPSTCHSASLHWMLRSQADGTAKPGLGKRGAEGKLLGDFWGFHTLGRAGAGGERGVRGKAAKRTEWLAIVFSRGL